MRCRLLVLGMAAAGAWASTTASQAAGPTLSSAMASAATASPKSYKNCKALNGVYPHGVGRRGGKDKTNGKPVTNFTANNSVYSLNRRLDRQGRHRLREALTPQGRRAYVKTPRTARNAMTAACNAVPSKLLLSLVFPARSQLVASSLTQPDAASRDSARTRRLRRFSMVF
jgi:Excalibur calcium-binding domain